MTISRYTFAKNKVVMNPKQQVTFSPLAKSIAIGSTYQHYRGNCYKVLAVAHHSETYEELVVYQALYGEHKVWVRPLLMFLEKVIYQEEHKPRFKLVNPRS